MRRDVRLAIRRGSLVKCPLQKQADIRQIDPEHKWSRTLRGLALDALVGRGGVGSGSVWTAWSAIDRNDESPCSLLESWKLHSIYNSLISGSAYSKAEKLTCAARRSSASWEESWEVSEGIRSSDSSNELKDVSGDDIPDASVSPSLGGQY